ncbi:MAG: hypothetical protein V8R91_04200 [Butyricimonas faecihominis]
MRNKTKHLFYQAIRKLIKGTKKQICSQEELLLRLKELNVEATQSTLSRDLKFMRVAKIPHKDKGYIYCYSRQCLGMNKPMKKPPPS